MRDEPWVMSCGAKDHEGLQRHHGAMVNWRRRLRGYRKVRRVETRWMAGFDDTPAIIRRSRMGLSWCNRRIIPTDMQYPPPDGLFAWKFRKRLMVMGRGDDGFDNGPVGVNYRQR